MSEPKPFASLSSGLLARKGAARPAMRPQGFGQVSAAGLDDLGWNDMGGEPQPVGEVEQAAPFEGEVVGHPRSGPSLGLSPIESPVHGQQAEIADRFSPEVDEDAFDEDYDETAEYEEEDVAAPVVAKASAFLTKTPALPVPSEEEYAFAARSVEEHEEDQEQDFDALELNEPVAFEAPVAFVPQVEEPAADMPVEEAPVMEAVADEPVLEAAPVADFAPSVEERVHPAVAAVVPDKAPRRAPKARSAPGLKGKAAFTLRLDPSRHLKLRLACAINGRSAQQLVTDALDQLLANMPELEAMAEKANRKG